MRTLFASALVLLACGCADRSSRPSGAGALPTIPGGPDAIVLRVSRGGGIVSASRYPGLDSVLWRSSQRVTSLARVLAFDPEDGFLAGVDSVGRPVRIDLRLGSVTTATGETPVQVSSADGNAIYALLRSGELTRFTASGSDWKYHPALPVSAMFPQDDGSLILAGVSKKRVLFWRVRPPGTELADSLSIDVSGTPEELSATLAAMGNTVGERVFVAAHQEVLAVRSRDLGKALEINMGETVRSIAATPSGDRLFVALTGEHKLRVINRFEESVVGTVQLPGEAMALRMDPLGRVVLVRGPGDSVWVVGVANDAVLGVVRSEWRADLPLVLPDGQLALARGADVALASNSTLKDVRVVAGAGRDFWTVLRWNGFRPRSSALDEPVHFRTSVSPDSLTRADSAARDSAAAAQAGAAAAARSAVATGQGARAPDPRDARDATSQKARDGIAEGGKGAAKDSAERRVFTVQFASVLSEELARNTAARIHVEGQTPRITTATAAGHTVYRVTLGPFASRADAERVGRAAGQPYWVFEGVP